MPAEQELKMDKKEEIKYSGKGLLAAFLVDRTSPAVRIHNLRLDLTRTIRKSSFTMRILCLLVEVIKFLSPFRDNDCLFFMAR